MLSHVPSFATPWIIACQAPLSMGSSMQEYRSGLPFTSGDLPHPGIEPASLTLVIGFLDSSPLSHLGSPKGGEIATNLRTRPSPESACTPEPLHPRRAGHSFKAPDSVCANRKIWVEKALKDHGLDTLSNNNNKNHNHWELYLLKKSNTSRRTVGSRVGVQKTNCKLKMSFGKGAGVGQL